MATDKQKQPNRTQPGALAEWIDQKLKLPVLTVPEAGTILGFERDTAYLLARNGDIPTIKVGSRLRVPTAHIRAMIAAA